MKSDAPELDLLFEAARPGAEPSAADRQRVTARVAQRLALGAGAGATALVVSRFGWASSVKTWMVLAVVAAGAGSGGYWLSGASLEQSSTSTAPAVARPEVAHAPPSVQASPAKPVPISSPEPGPVVAPAPVRRERAAAAVAAPSASSPPVLEPSSLARETAALRDANATLRAGAPARALELLDDLTKQFPRGMLAEEALATRISALCALGRVAEARSLGSRFVQRYPRSPVAARVRSSCGSPR